VSLDDSLDPDIADIMSTPETETEKSEEEHVLPGEEEQLEGSFKDYLVRSTIM
jgi:hypothetical protein